MLAVISSDRELIGFDKSDVVVSNGYALAWRARNPKLYDLQIRCTNSSGFVSITVPANCCSTTNGLFPASDVSAKLPIAWAPWAADVRRSHYVVRGRWTPTASLLLSNPGEETVAMEFAWISPGTYEMGNAGHYSEPSRETNEIPHKVVITKGFWIATSECTQKQWSTVMSNNPSFFVRSGDEAAVYPVDSVSWNAANQFMSALNSRYQGLGIRLPTEAEWEFACRADTTTAFYTGPDDITGDASSRHLVVMAWFAGNSANWHDGKETETPPTNAVDISSNFTSLMFGPPEYTEFGPHMISNHAKNDWGLKDSSRNDAEWCFDSYVDDLGTNVVYDPVSTGGVLRVVRGGAWNSPAADCRSCARSGAAPDLSRYDIGFRPVIPGDTGFQGGQP
jgi:formylglycine-generating enzyme required for sulfatase activity